VSGRPLAHRALAPLFAFGLLGLLGLPGTACRAPDAAIPVVDLGGPPAPSADPGHPPSPPSAPEREGQAFLGTWEDRSTVGHVNSRVEMVEGVPTVVSVKEVIGDREIYKLESSTFTEGELRWVYYVPSTEYRVEFKAKKPHGEVMPSSWSNSANASGEADLFRVRRATP
jgi:hypothetical protein